MALSNLGCTASIFAIAAVTCAGVALSSWITLSASVFAASSSSWILVISLLYAVTLAGFLPSVTPTWFNPGRFCSNTDLSAFNAFFASVNWVNASSTFAFSFLISSTVASPLSITLWASELIRSASAFFAL